MPLDKTDRLPHPGQAGRRARLLADSSALLGRVRPADLPAVVELIRLASRRPDLLPGINGVLARYAGRVKQPAGGAGAPRGT